MASKIRQGSRLVESEMVVVMVSTICVPVGWYWPQMVHPENGGEVVNDDPNGGGNQGQWRSVYSDSMITMVARTAMEEVPVVVNGDGTRLVVVC